MNLFCLKITKNYKFIDRLSRSVAEYEERTGNLEEALKELAAAVQLDHKLKIADYSYEIALEAMGKLPEAANEYNLALKPQQVAKRLGGRASGDITI
jgi:tetratricopeptide (TPR) repeat protein